MAKRRKRLDDEGVKNLKPKKARYAHPDPEQRGHYIRVTPKGIKTFVVVANDPNKKQVWVTIGRTDVMEIEKAREKARGAIRAIKSGADRGGPQSFATVAEQWLTSNDP